MVDLSSFGMQMLYDQRLVLRYIELHTMRMPVTEYM